MHQHGIGLEKDKPLAKRYYDNGLFLGTITTISRPIFGQVQDLEESRDAYTYRFAFGPTEFRAKLRTVYGDVIDKLLEF